MASKECLTKRSILWCLIFLGCGVNYMIRTNINIAIVAMVKSRDSAQDSTILVSECFQAANHYSSNMSVNKSSEPQGSQDDANRFDWDEHQQNLVMGSFFWLYWIAQIPGGYFGQRFGTKKVFGLANFSISVTTFMIPFLASLDYRILVILRIFQGMCGGLCWPALNYAISQWVPPNDRSKFLSAYMGSSVGSALTFPFCGMLIHYFNWQAVFYVTGGIGVIWFVSWWIFVYDKPEDHPTISQTELKYIQSSIGNTVSKNTLPIPWIKILTSWPLCANILLSWGCIWGMFTILTQAPTYLQNIHGWSIQRVGIFTGLPHFARLGVAIIMGYLCDHLRASGKLSATNIRKFAGIITNTVQGIFMLGLAFSGCNSTAAIIFLTAAMAASGGETSGSLATYIDLSPNFSSLVTGIGNMVSVTPGFISSAIVGAFTYQNQTAEQWKKVFLISAAVLIVPGVIHITSSSAEIQEWNSPQRKSVTEKDSEAQRSLTAESGTDNREKE